MKNQFNSLMKIQFVFAAIFLFPIIVKAQNEDENIHRLTKEREIIIQKIDSLKNQLDAIDTQLTNAKPEDRLQAMISKYGKNKGKLIAEGKVWMSISYEMAIDSWGEPIDIQKSIVTSGTTQKWIYPEEKYLFFKNDRLQSWKE